MAVALVVISCHTSKPASVTPAPIATKEIGKELNSNWQLQKLWASDNKWPKNPVIIFDYEQKTFTGNNGCNNIRGKFKSSGSFIAFDKQMISTRMACSGYNENTFNNALLKVNKFTIKDEELELSQDEIVLFSFKKQ
jgi:heat shock protein HslJ